MAPTLMPRPDGVGMFLAGGITALFGASTAGKSLVVLEAIMRPPVSGPVVWVDLDENTKNRTLKRLQELGHGDSNRGNPFHYVGAEEITRMGGLRAAWAWVRRIEAVVVVIDSVTAFTADSPRADGKERSSIDRQRRPGEARSRPSPGAVSEQRASGDPDRPRGPREPLPTDRSIAEAGQRRSPCRPVPGQVARRGREGHDPGERGTIRATLTMACGTGQATTVE